MTNGETRPGADMSLLLEAREIVKAQPRSDKIDHLRSWADAFETAWKDVSVRPTRRSLQQLNACAVRLCRAIDFITATEPPSPQGGAVRLDEQQLAA